MITMDFGIVINDNEEHSAKHLSSIEVTEFGSIMDTNEEHP
jgi:hypothetical protein